MDILTYIWKIIFSSFL